MDAVSVQTCYKGFSSIDHHCKKKTSVRPTNQPTHAMIWKEKDFQLVILAGDSKLDQTKTACTQGKSCTECGICLHCSIVSLCLL